MNMEGLYRGVVEALKLIQDKSELCECPRCGKPIATYPSARKYESIYADVFICKDCKGEEKVRKLAGVPLAFENWHSVQKLRKGLPYEAYKGHI